MSTRSTAGKPCAPRVSGLMVMGSSAASSSYTDVADTDNVEAIEVLKTVGIMVGDESGDFNPDQNVTRNEMAVVMSNLMAYNVATYANTSPFTDVPSWAEPYVAACWTNGITAGTSATTYGGSESVTTAQAALMLMKALGYFQYNQDFGTDWQLSTVRQGNAIDLFDGVDSGVTDSMTRNDVAQLVLNTLESGMVSATTSGNITVGGVTIATSVEYNYITSNAGYASSISSDRSTDANSDATQPIVELGEDLYQGDLTKEKDHDAFGRPAAIWSYQDDEIGTYVDDTTASWTTKVSERDLYRAAGTSAVNNYDWTVWVNGEVVDDSVNGYDLDRNDTDRWQTTGNGVLTEMFVDTVAETVDVTIIHSYVAEVSRVVSNEDDGDYTVTVNFKTRPDGVSVNREFNTETEYAQDDIVIVNIANGSIEAMSLAETVEGTIAAVKDNDYLRIDGTTYNYNYAYTTGNLLAGYSDTNKGLYDLENSTPANPGAGDEVIVYLDGNGSAVAIADAGEVAEDYIYVKGAHELYGDYSARVVYYDGTQEDIDIDEVDNTDNFKYAGAETEYDEAQELGIGVYKFSRSGNAYDLSSSEAANPEFSTVKMANFKIENGRARIGEYIGGAYTGNVYSVGSNTVFVDAYNNTAYTGYQNVPTMNYVEGWIVFDGTGTVADIVYITNDVQYEADNDSFFLVTSSGAEEEYNENGNVYNYTVWINGAEETLTASSRLRNLTVGLWKITQYDSNGRVSDVEQVLDENDLLNVGATSTAYATVANYTGLTVANAAISDKSVDNVLDANNRFTIDDETLFVVAYLNDDNTEIDDSSITAVTGPSGLGDINVVDANNLRDNETSAVYILNVDDVDEVAPTAKLVLVVNPDPESGSQGGGQNIGLSVENAVISPNGRLTLTVGYEREDYMADDAAVNVSFRILANGAVVGNDNAVIPANGSTATIVNNAITYEEGDRITVELISANEQAVNVRYWNADGSARIESQLNMNSTTSTLSTVTGEPITITLDDTTMSGTAASLRVTNIDNPINQTNSTTFTNGVYGPTGARTANGDDYVDVYLNLTGVVATYSYTNALSGGMRLDAVESSVFDGTNYATDGAKNLTITVTPTPGSTVTGGSSYNVSVTLAGGPSEATAYAVSIPSLNLSATITNGSATPMGLLEARGDVVIDASTVVVTPIDGLGLDKTRSSWSSNSITLVFNRALDKDDAESYITVYDGTDNYSIGSEIYTSLSDDGMTLTITALAGVSFKATDTIVVTNTVNEATGGYGSTITAATIGTLTGTNEIA